MKRYALRTGEFLAVSSDAIRRDSDGFFLLLSGEAPANETRGSVILVNIRGALQQFCSPEGDSYEGIVDRVAHAFTSDPKPSSVVLRISSPGGVVAGLNETVFKLKRMSKEAGIPLIAYVDELAASAAYALCCACSEVLSPPSGVCGSIGVISTMVSVAEHDKMEGIAYRIITSGKRKADGHLHMPISDDAVKAETSRNAELADQFYALASKARGLSPEKLAGLEANIFLGKQAKRVGLVDDVLSLDDMMLGLDKSEVKTESDVAPNEGNITDRRAKELASLDGEAVCAIETSNPPEDQDMSTKLAVLIKKTEAAIASEVDSKKLASLHARLAAFTATKAEMDDDDGDDDKKKKGDSDDDEGDESKAVKAAKKAEEAKKAAEAAKHRARAAEFKKKAEESEEAAKKAEEDDEEEEEAATHTSAPAALTPGASAALVSQAEMATEALARVRKLEAQAEERDRQSLITELVAQRRVMPHEAKKWAKKDRTFWAQVQEMRPNALVAVTEDALSQPDGSPDADIPANIKKFVDQAIEAMGLTGEKADKFREQSIADHRNTLAKTNGAGVSH